MTHSASLKELIDSTAWIDTHEHLLEEHSRLRTDSYTFVTGLNLDTRIPPDWTVLIVHYALDDLISAGMPLNLVDPLLADGLGPLEKWELVESYFEAARLTGYLRAVDLTTEQLFGARLSRETCEEIDRRCRELRRPGYYRDVLNDVARVERCQVNSIEEDPFCVTRTPDLLDQDLSLVPLVLGRHSRAESLSGIHVGGIDDYLGVVEWCFDAFGDRAIAVKCPWAYLRTLEVQDVDVAPRRAFRRLRAGEATLRERRLVEDFLFRRCLELASDADLPVKLHLGTLAMHSRTQLPQVFRHVADVAPIVQRHPRTTFVLMHTAWPQQEQLLALAKHQPNVVVDLCWSWILAPLSTTEFVQRFLTTVPASKLLCFGGDYITVENVVGHAELARRGLQAALEGLIAAEWLTGDDALALVPLLMRENADRLFYGRIREAR